MVEPDLVNLECGKHNFALNNYVGDFIHQKVCKGAFEVDRFLDQKSHKNLTILHSDIQGFELEMLECADETLRSHRVDYIFLSTHSQALHQEACQILESYGYRIEVSSDFDTHTTSFDGFILASNPNIKPVFKNFYPMGRLDILKSNPGELIDSLLSLR